ncbi:hypothetical protein [Mesorhizobium sp. M0199]|uniref:hypothetical protein n=1 Tax=Mesorhizobium sp. M0199 TaxID=2956911 RepID=UPI00333806F0
MAFKKISIYLLIAAVGLSISCLKSPASVLSKLNDLVSENKVVDPDMPDIRISTFSIENPGYQISSSKTKNKYYVNINRIIVANAVNVFILTQEQFDEAGVPYDCGCAARVIDGVRYIFCDASFLRTFSRGMEHEVFKDDSGVPAQAIRNWIIYHEVAHHHFDHPMLYKRFISPWAMRQYEQEADTLAANAFVEPDLQTKIFESYFANAGSNNTSYFDDMYAYIVSSLDQFGSSHESMDLRLSSFVDTIKYIFPTGANYRETQTPTINVSSLSLCSSNYEWMKTRNLYAFSLLFISTAVANRGAFAEYLHYSVEEVGKLPDDQAPVRTVLLFEYCQSLILSGAKCDVQFEGKSDKPIDSFLDDMMSILSQQNELIKKRLGQENRYAIKSVLPIAARMTNGIYREIDGKWLSLSLTYLTFLQSDGRFYNCGSGGNGLSSSASEFYSCKDFAEEVRDGIHLDERGQLAAVNMMEALDISDGRGLQAKADLVTILATQFPLGYTHPFVVSALSEIVSKPGLMEEANFLSLAFYGYLEVGDEADANALGGRLIESTRAAFENQYERSIALMDLGDSCVNQLVAICAIRAYQEADDSAQAYLITVKGEYALVDRAQYLLRTIHFARVKANVIGGSVDEALVSTVEKEAVLDNGEDAVATYEVLAESFIWLGDFKRARYFFDKGAEIASKSPERDVERRTSSLTYEVAITYLEGDWSKLHDALDRLDSLTEQSYGFAISGSVRPFAIAGRLVPGRLIKLEMETHVTH